MWIDGWRRDKEGPVFVPLTRSGRVAAERPLSAHQLWKIVRRRCAQSGLAPGVTTHDFRRYAVGQMLDRGVDLSTVARAIGHKRVETTIGYDRRPVERIRDAVELIDLPAVADLPERRE